jgi:pullulanase
MTEASAKRYGIIAATASLVLAACSPSSDGGSGAPVTQELPQTISTGFDFTALGSFSVGTSPDNAVFSGGIATNGEWIIRDGDTGVVTFTTPTRDVEFTIEGLTEAATAALFAKAGLPNLSRKTTCGVSDQGLDNSEALGQEVFMRGGFNDWGNPSPPDEFLFINFGEGVYQAEFEIVAGEYNYKIGSAGWEVERATDPDDVLEAGDTQPLVDPGPGGPEGKMNVAEDGCYNFTANYSDAEAPTLTMTKVTLDDGGGGTPPGQTTCGVEDQGLDNSEALGQELFMRGGFNDWGNPSPPDEFLFINFGGGQYQAEFEIVAGEYNYKIGSAGWEVERATDPDDVLEDGDTQPLVDPGPGGPEGKNSDPDNPTITMTKVELGGGTPPGQETCGVDDQGLDNSEALGQEMFMRGGFNDWGNPSPTDEFLFINVGGGEYQAEFEIVAGEYNYKVGSAGWEVERATERADVLEVDDTQALVDPGPGGPEGILNAPEDGCYNFTANYSDPDNPTITMTSVELGGGGPPPGEPETTDVTATNRDGGTEELEIEGTSLTTVSFERGRTDSPVQRIEIFAGNGDVAVDSFTWVANPVDRPDQTGVSVSYHRPDDNYADTVVVVDGVSYTCAASDFGCTATDVPAPQGGSLTFTVAQNGSTDPTGTFLAAIPSSSTAANDVFAFSGSTSAVTGEASAPGEDEVLLYYSRADGDYTGWNLHLFPRDPATPDWTIFNGAEACIIESQDSIGAYFRITLPPNSCYDANPDPLDAFPNVLGLVIHNGGAKAPDGDVLIRIATDGNIVFVDEGSPDVSSAPPGEGGISISGRAAHWVDSGTLLWNIDDEVVEVEMLWSADASIRIQNGVISGNFESATLSEGVNPEPQNQLHLGGYPAFALPETVSDDATNIVRYQLVAVGRDRFGVPVSATFIQTPGALDDIFANAATSANLGVTWDGTTPTISVWAPTAYPDTGVTLNLYSAPGVLDNQVAMSLDETSGIWSAAGDSGWDRMYYDFTLDVYSYATGRIETNTVTDPYSVSLSANSRHSQVVNLDDQDLKPAGWDDLTLPEYGEPEDIVIYEQQMRDFSASDFTVPEGLRGKYKAFTLDNTDGHAQLQALSDAGLTHMHLLPSFDIATIEEERENRVELDDPVEDLCAANSNAAELCPQYNGMTIRELLEMKTVEDPASEFQQQVVVWLRNLDGYNWGYDPWHYGVPEGSYASDPDGVARIIEYREMVQGLAAKDLRLVIDVVYNHTNEGGQGDKSVLGRVVPGYYHRYDETSGAILTSTCCANTASEFAMMGKLMDDTMIRFLEDYKITGFRFDLMGFHTKAQMEALLATLRGIDPSVYIYGEGWNFGEVANDRRFVQATQENMAGTDIGTFTDRIRDAVRGGGPFDSGAARTRNQGFINGGGYDPNADNSLEDEAFMEEALCTSDQIRATMAGSISDYTFEDRTGAPVTGADLGYSSCTGTSPTGYVSDPSEIINYASSHDNETIFDISQYKHPTAVNSADRVRAENVGMDVVVLAQGVPFLHSGQDLLRSKSVDRNSFDFGDWFNKQDFSRMDNNWAVGLPSAESNQDEWPDIAELFDNPNSVMTADDINFAHEHLKEMLQIRASTVLYRLRTGDDIKERIEYFNTGPDQTPGLIAQGIDGCTSDNLTPEYGYVMTIVNANDEDQTLELFTERTFDLHPVQQASVDPVVQTAKHDGSGFFVPARTTAVFVESAQFACSPFGVSIFVRGLNADWDTADASNELPFDGDTGYAGTLPLNGTTADDLSFKIADAAYSVVNCGAGADANVQLDQPYALNCDASSGNLTLNVGATGNYRFMVDASDVDTPVLTVFSSPYAVDIFVRGFDADWNASDETRMDLVASDTYQVELGLADPAAAGALDFKVASDDWSTVDCGSDGTNVALGVAYSPNCAGGAPNMVLDATEAGQYSFRLDAADPANPTLTVDKGPYPVPIFVRGLNQDWTESNPMRFMGGTSYNVTIRLTGLTAGDLDFKIASSDWSTVDCGDAGGGSVDPGVLTTLNCAGGAPNLVLSADALGKYEFSLDATDTTNPDLLVSGP